MKKARINRRNSIIIIFFCIGGLLFLNVIVLLCISNFHIGLALQLIISVIIFLYAIFFKRVKKIIHIAICIIFLTLCVLGSVLAFYGLKDNSDYNEDAILVLGSGINGEEVGASLAKRLDKAVDYHIGNPKAVIVVCGGQGPQEDITEALAMERYLVGKGIPENTIIKEEQSTSTYENLLYAKEILDNRFPQGFTSVLITNEYHIYRAVKTADYINMATNHINARTQWYTIPSAYLREMLAVLKIWFFPPY